MLQSAGVVWCGGEGGGLVHVCGVGAQLSWLWQDKRTGGGGNARAARGRGRGGGGGNCTGSQGGGHFTGSQGGEEGGALYRGRGVGGGVGGAVPG